MKKNRTTSNKNIAADFADVVMRKITKQSTSRVQYSGVVFDKNEVEKAFGALYDAFVSGWFALGNNASAFEERFSKLLGIKHCILTNSGSSANLLAVASLVHLGYLKMDDEILTPATTFPTTVNPTLLYGLKPVLVDVDLPSYTVSAETLARSSSSKTKGLMLPHLNGSASYMPSILALARKKGWVIIEDCCDALGTTIGKKYVGTFGNVSTFSFYAAHHIFMGEGGAVCTDDPRVAEAVRSLRDWGRMLKSDKTDLKEGRDMERVGKGTQLPEDYETRYSYAAIGFNLKPLDLQAAIGLAQLRKLAAFKQARIRNYRFLFRILSKYTNRLVLPEPLKDVETNWFVFPILVKEDAPFSRKDLVDYLESKGIETRPILAGNILKQPAYAKTEFTVRSELLNSELILRRGFFIGLYPGIKKEQLGQIRNAFDDFFHNVGEGVP